MEPEEKVEKADKTDEKKQAEKKTDTNSGLAGNSKELLSRKEKEAKKVFYYMTLLQNACIAGRLKDIYQKEKKLLEDRMAALGVPLDDEKIPAEKEEIKGDLRKLESAYKYFRTPVFAVMAKKTEYLQKQIDMLIKQNRALAKQVEELKKEYAHASVAEEHGKATEENSSKDEDIGNVPEENVSSRIKKEKLPESPNKPQPPKFVKGGIIEIGIYPYDADGRMKPVEWIILEEYKDGTALVISKYGVDSKPFNEEYAAVTWKSSTVRKWLNSSFFSSVFSAREQTGIINTIVPGTAADPEDTGENISDSGDTKDKLFLLSADEAEKYFHGDDARRARPTPYAVQRGAYLNGTSGWWWLRTSGGKGYKAAAVNLEGGINEPGLRVNSDTEAVRIAMRINLSLFR